MHQSDLNRAVSRATGETVSTIKRLGFLIADPDLALDPHDEDLGPYMIDWDELEAAREREEVLVPACA
ncbi:hypothetical protein [Blastopirellula retiformator]|uniref:Uncharacterized protein n=1 Tax=Blastopirellula retiformator TaxID=2527970 RepID=A0A5C5VLN6_9BACT|nr:hypothetical protein [Blastopirellula retiformator]TWT38937.1 hypothetical protein Enr8_06310 [Blastopirellula retiformator]